MAGRVLCDLSVAVLLMSLAIKVNRPRRYLEAARAYTALKRASDRVVATLAVLVGCAELAVVLLFLSPVPETVTVAVAAGLLVALSVLTVTDERPTYDNCGCGGVSSITMPKSAYRARSVVMAGIASVSTVLLLSQETAAYSRANLAIHVARLLVSLPLAAVVLDLPLLVHMKEVERKKLPAKVVHIRNRFAATHLDGAHDVLNTSGASS